MTLREQPLLRFLAASALLHAGFLSVLQFGPLPDPLPDGSPLRVRFVEPPAGPLVEQPPPARPEPPPPGAKAIGRASSRAKAPGPGTGPIGSAGSRGTPRLPASPLPAAPGLPRETPPPRVLEARPAPEARVAPLAPAPPPQAAAPPVPVVPPPAPSPSREPSQGARLSLREQLDRIGNRALVSPVPGPYDAGQAGEGSGREATVALESRAHEYAAYLEKVKRRVEWVWGYPRLARELGLSGKVIIEFTILRDGGLGPLRVVDSSGVSILDDAAVEAIRRAAPYAPLPEAMGLESRTILASFEYHVGAVRLPGGP